VVILECNRDLVDVIQSMNELLKGVPTSLAAYNDMLGFSPTQAKT